MFASKRVGTQLETHLGYVCSCWFSLAAGCGRSQLSCFCQFCTQPAASTDQQKQMCSVTFAGHSAWATLFILCVLCCRLRDITGLASRASQACFLVNLLISRQLPRLVTLLEEPWRKRLAALSLREVVCSKDGEDTMTQLISVLLDEHQASPGMYHAGAHKFQFSVSLQTDASTLTLVDAAELAEPARQHRLQRSMQ